MRLRQHDVDEIDRLRHLVERWIGLVAHDFAAAAVDRIERALEAAVGQIGEQHAAGLGRVLDEAPMTAIERGAISGVMSLIDDLLAAQAQPAHRARGRRARVTVKGLISISDNCRWRFRARAARSERRGWRAMSPARSAGRRAADASEHARRTALPSAAPRCPFALAAPAGS